MQPSDMDAFVKTLRDPAGGLVYQGNLKSQQRRESFPEGTVLVGTVKKGAKLFATTNNRSKPILELV